MQSIGEDDYARVQNTIEELGHTSYAIQLFTAWGNAYFARQDLKGLKALLSYYKNWGASIRAKIKKDEAKATKQQATAALEKIKANEADATTTNDMTNTPLINKTIKNEATAALDMITKDEATAAINRAIGDEYNVAMALFTELLNKVYLLPTQIKVLKKLGLCPPQGKAIPLYCTLSAGLWDEQKRLIVFRDPGTGGITHEYRPFRSDRSLGLYEIFDKESDQPKNTYDCIESVKRNGIEYIIQLMQWYTQGSENPFQSVGRLCLYHIFVMDSYAKSGNVEILKDLHDREKITDFLNRAERNEFRGCPFMSNQRWSSLAGIDDLDFIHVQDARNTEQLANMKKIVSAGLQKENFYYTWMIDRVGDVVDLRAVLGKQHVYAITLLKSGKKVQYVIFDPLPMYHFDINSNERARLKEFINVIEDEYLSVK